MPNQPKTRTMSPRRRALRIREELEKLNERREKAKLVVADCDTRMANLHHKELTGEVKAAYDEMFGTVQKGAK